MSKVLSATVLTVTVVLGLSACSSGSSSSGSSSTTKAAKTAAAPVTLSGKVNNKGTKNVSTKGSTATVDLDLYNFYFEPSFVKVAPGQKLTITLHNEGSVPHTFTAPSLNIDKELQPDAKTTVTVTMPMSGTVPFYCRFHKDNGMQGAMYMTTS
jgi:plastocyanin